MTKRDFLTLIRLPILFMLAWVLPERTWASAAGFAAWIASRLKPTAYDKRVNMFARTYGVRAEDRQVKQAALRASVTSHQSVMQCFREYRWGGWNPEIRVSGREHLEAALDQGKGAILWVQTMPFSDLVSKKAFAQLGYPPHHLSRPGHGFSGSRFGIRFLNPIWTSIEDRYLSERITIRGESALVAVRVLLSRLAKNHVVSITVDPQAVKTLKVSFFNAKIILATAPISLSLRHGVPLLPVFTIRAPGNGFEVVIGSVLSAGREVGAADGITVIADAYISRLEALYREHKDQRAVLPGLLVDQD